MSSPDRAPAPTRGILLLNLGTPDAAEPEAVGRYLREFLMDPLVIDIPAMARQLLVKVAIVPRRKFDSAEAYQKIWTDRGSPLLFHTEDLTEKVRERLEGRAQVEFCMRYGEPSVRSGLEKMKAHGVTELLVCPLYPQYSLAATESSIREVRRVAKALGSPFALEFLPAFYDAPPFIRAFAAVGRDSGALEGADHVLFSFHGIPERHVKKTDPTGAHCLASGTCCDRIGDANRDCYRAQSYATARALAQALELEDGKWSVSFQSRLGRTPWIRPYTDVFFEEAPARGIKKLAVYCPAFVADCLETLEEIEMRGDADFRKAGGEWLRLVPSLNASDHWADAVAELVA